MVVLAVTVVVPNKKVVEAYIPTPSKTLVLKLQMSVLVAVVLYSVDVVVTTVLLYCKYWVTTVATVAVSV